MSQHVIKGVENEELVFGWDQPLQSFYLQHHKKYLPEDEQIVVRMGADTDTKMYEVEDLVREARKLGFHIDHQMRVELYGEKDDGR